jgi:polysaccharide deacetylase family protein (PEP-CTERM system associated)
VFSVDVEDWFHILDVPSAPDLASWSNLPSRVEANFLRLLDMFSEEHKQVTCFFLGWIAERFPHLVREASARGHEIASHGYSHQLVYKMTQTKFRDDIRRARLLLEDISGAAVIGYRAPGFSSTERTPWFFKEVSNSGYCYDSSVFPARRGHGGNPKSQLKPHFLLDGQLIEFPVTVSEIGPSRICFFGGGYLRLFPYVVIRHMALRNLDRGIPLIFYIHPREIDPNQPRIRMSLHRRFKSYVNVDTTERKVRRIMRDFPVTTCRDYLFGAAPGTFVDKPGTLVDKTVPA